MFLFWRNILSLEKRGIFELWWYFLKNLNDIETLSAAFANGIIIIHDSISTGAELAAFASNEMLKDKMCVLEPDSTGIEERKISAFLELAFLVRILKYVE